MMRLVLITEMCELLSGLCRVQQFCCNNITAHVLFCLIVLYNLCLLTNCPVHDLYCKSVKCVFSLNVQWH